MEVKVKEELKLSVNSTMCFCPGAGMRKDPAGEQSTLSPGKSSEVIKRRIKGVLSQNNGVFRQFMKKRKKGKKG